jgi:hypothetical protein
MSSHPCACVHGGCQLRGDLTQVKEVRAELGAQLDAQAQLLHAELGAQTQQLSALTRALDAERDQAA